VQIGTFPNNSLDQIKTISGDPNIYGQVYVGFSGSGYAYLPAAPTTIPAAPTLALGTGVSNGATLAEAIQASGVVTVAGALNDAILVTFANGANTVIKTLTGTGSTQAITLTATDVSTLTDGTISVNATQTDAAGTAVATTSFVLDTTAPSIAINTIAGD